MSAACTASLLAGAAAAEDESPWSVTGTVGVTSNYMFRGITQSDGEAALQASVTVAHESGFYAGFWGSNIDFNDGFFSGKEAAELETDLYIGYGGSLGENTTFDLNVTYYAYPGSYGPYNYDYFEFIAGVAHDFGVAKIGVKAAYSPEFFGDTGDAFWLGGTLSVPFTDWLSASGNVGYQWVDENFGGEDYMHYDIGLTATYMGVSFDVRYVATDLDFVDEEFVGTVTFSF
jgi:uncharacterized protein (TIGR02001 family)